MDKKNYKKYYKLIYKNYETGINFFNSSFGANCCFIYGFDILDFKNNNYLYNFGFSILQRE